MALRKCRPKANAQTKRTGGTFVKPTDGGNKIIIEKTQVI